MRRWCCTIVVAASCAGDKDTGPIEPPPTETGTPPTTDTAPERPGPDLVVTADQVYAMHPSYRVDDRVVRSEYDLLVTWPDMTTDGWGVKTDPLGFDYVVLLEILAQPDEVADRLEADDLGADLVSTWTLPVDSFPTAHLTDLASGASTFDPATYLVENPDKVWVLGLADADGDRLDLRSLLTLVPDDLSQETGADMQPLGSSFGYTAALDGAHLATATGWELYTLDWSALTTDALGKAYDDELGDELFLARFDDPSGLEASVLDWEALAAEWYTMDVERETDARLDLARDGEGAVFPGFSEGTWLVGVRCSSCFSPFPLWVVTVDVSS